jgi:quercetin dioxygenase-like cupin family protein
MTPPGLSAALDAARIVHRMTPALSDFAPWPGVFSPANLSPRHIPAADLVAALNPPASGHCRPLVEATRAFAPQAHWKRTYTEDEVGADFRARYGYFELFGPAGHVRTDQLRGYIAYWGAGLSYDWHYHEAEEIYFILAGEAEFHGENSAPVRLNPGQTRQHRANQPHAMCTHDAPVLTFVLWRGTGLDGLPYMGLGAPG